MENEVSNMLDNIEKKEGGGQEEESRAELTHTDLAIVVVRRLCLTFLLIIVIMGILVTLFMYVPDIALPALEIIVAIGILGAIGYLIYDCFTESD